MREYDRIADWYVKNRDPHVGVPEVLELVADLPPGSPVLDLGCGHGVPIARVLADRGLAVHGIDSSEEMIARFRAELPEAPTECTRIQDSALFGRSFLAVVAWGVLFHLAPRDQAVVIREVAGRLRPGGRLLFTAGATEGERTGEMNGVRFRYFSLGAARYRSLLGECGFDGVRDRPDAADNHVYTATAVESAA